jgi:hypothetical protein
MAFTVEDGTGVVDANAYCEIAFVTDYLTERNRVTAWAALSTPVQQAAIIAATDYIELMNSRRFRGVKEFPETPQGLSFPRVDIYDREGYAIEGVPLKVKQATAEYADRARADDLLPDPATSSVGGAVIETEEVVGPLKSRIKYEPGSTSSVTIKPYPAADRLLGDFVVNRNGVIR